MIVEHRRTGTKYRIIGEAWCTDTQRPTVVYISLTNGCIFTRDKERFDARFKIVDSNPQLGLEPNTDQPELQFPERGTHVDQVA